MLLGSSCLKLLVPCVITLPWPAMPARIHPQGSMRSDCKERTYPGTQSALFTIITSKLDTSRYLSVIVNP